MNMSGVNNPIVMGNILPPGYTNSMGGFRGGSPNLSFQPVFLAFLQGELSLGSEPVVLEISALLEKVEQLLQSLGFGLVGPGAESAEVAPPVFTSDEQGDEGWMELDSQILALLGFTSNEKPAIPLLGQSGQPAPKDTVSLLESIRMILLSAQKGELRLDQATLQKLSALVEQIARMDEANHAIQMVRGNPLSRDGGKALIAEAHPNGHDPFSQERSVREASTATRLQESWMTAKQTEEIPPHLKKIGFQQLQGIRPMISEPAVSHGTPLPTADETYVSAERFHRQIQDILVRQIQMTRFPNGVSEARIRLIPENLGAIDIRITVQQGMVSAQFAADSQLGKELLESHLQALRTHLIQQGFHVEKLEIAGPNAQENQPSPHSFAGDERQQRGREPIFQNYEQDREESEQQFAELMQIFNQQI